MLAEIFNFFDEILFYNKNYEKIKNIHIKLTNFNWLLLFSADITGDK